MRLFAILALAVASFSIEKDHRYGVTFRHDANAFEITVVDHATGKRIDVPLLHARVEERVRTTVWDAGTAFNITAVAHADGSAVVTLAAFRDGVQVDAVVNTFRPAPDFTSLPTNTVSFDFADVDVKDALRQLAAAGRVTMFVDPQIRARVTLSVHDLPWRAAFDAMMVKAGLRYRIEREGIFVRR